MLVDVFLTFMSRFANPLEKRWGPYMQGGSCSNNLEDDWRKNDRMSGSVTNGLLQPYLFVLLNDVLAMNK